MPSACCHPGLPPSARPIETQQDLERFDFTTPSPDDLVKAARRGPAGARQQAAPALTGSGGRKEAVQDTAARQGVHKALIDCVICMQA